MAKDDDSDNMETSDKVEGETSTSVSIPNSKQDNVAEPAETYVELLSIADAIRTGVVVSEDINPHRALSRVGNGFSPPPNSVENGDGPQPIGPKPEKDEFLKCKAGQAVNPVLCSNSEELVNYEFVDTVLSDQVIEASGEECVSNYLRAEFIQECGMWQLEWFIQSSCDAAMAPINQDDFIGLYYTGKSFSSY